MSEFKLVPVKNVDGECCDCIVTVHTDEKIYQPFQKCIDEHLGFCKVLPYGETAVLPLKDVPAGRLVVTSTGPLDPDYDDVRSIKEAAYKSTQKALSMGVKNPVVVLNKHSRFENARLVTLLGVLDAMYVPLQAKQLKPSLARKINQIGVFSEDGDAEQIIDLAVKLDAGLRVAKDIGDGDPEFMAPIKVQEYVEKQFANSSIKITVVDKEEDFKKEYPLFECVNRAASVVPRHQGRIIFLEYSPCASQVKETLLLVGKGVTYDTGGADIKYGGSMMGMSRDKCGAAAVAGFMEVCNQLKPSHVKVLAVMGMVRNSVGSNAYVADELVKSRNGNLVRIGNTDAEGRMVMGDLLCKMRELAVDCVNPHLFTIATLTGHACIAVGEGYSIVVDNGPAAKAKNAERFRAAGESMAEPVEISTLRREDFAFITKGKCATDDIMQCNCLPSSRTPRGHQFPAAFLSAVAGLQEHGSGSEKPLKYSHLDIAASSGSLPDPCTGAPILAMAKTYLLNPTKE